MRRLLIAGVPRSGTTWVGRVLRRTSGTCYVDEPDNETKEPFALKAKTSFGAFPMLSVGDRAGDLETLWGEAFAGRVRSAGKRDRVASFLLQRVPGPAARSTTARHDPRPTTATRMVRRLARPPGRDQIGKQLLVKSVYSALCLEWIVERWQPAVLVVKRHPYNVVSSWMTLGWDGHDLHSHPGVRARYVEPLGLPHLDTGASRIERLAWEVGLLEIAVDRALSEHPEWTVIRHEEMCGDPLNNFKRLCVALGLEWTDRAEAWLEASNAPGEKLQVKRVATEEAERWRTRMTTDEIQTMEEVLARFPLKSPIPRGGA